MQPLNWTSKVGESLTLSVPDDFDLAADMRAFMDEVRATTVGGVLMTFSAGGVDAAGAIR